MNEEKELSRITTASLLAMLAGYLLVWYHCGLAASLGLMLVMLGNNACDFVRLTKLGVLTPEKALQMR